MFANSLLRFISEAVTGLNNFTPLLLLVLLCMLVEGVGLRYSTQ